MANCANTSINLTPLEELGASTYQGQQGGLYPGGSNDLPAGHLAAGIAAGQAIQPINGKIGLLTTGMSNAARTMAAFTPMANAHPSKRPEVVIVDGTQPGEEVDDWIAKPNHPTSPWQEVARRVAAAGLTASQVQAMWFYHAEGTSAELAAFPSSHRAVAQNLLSVIVLAEQRYPNLRQVHLASLTYMGYALNPDRQEPRMAYQQQWAVKWAIEADILGSWTGRSWLGWSVQQWCDGTTPRSDGWTWLCEDVEADGVHPSVIGAQKTAQRVLDRYLTDPTTGWFRV